jgi:hypothetical protein
MVSPIGQNFVNRAATVDFGAASAIIRWDWRLDRAVSPQSTPKQGTGEINFM